MELRAAYDEAVRLLAEHGLGQWRVELDTAKRRAGVCRFRDRVIGLSAPLARLHSESEVRDTVLHEIAHALSGPGAGHGPRWQAEARRLGCSTQRCLPADAPRVPGAWVGVCRLGHVTERHRRPDRVVACARCSSVFDLQHVLEWTHHGRPAPMHPNFVAELEALAAGRPPSRLPVGATVRLLAPGRYAGRVGTVLRRGRTRYHVRLPEGVLTTVFAHVEECDADVAPRRTGRPARPG
ncbi:MAG: SprT-like domain-containing protein [Nocardioidaceae bacterium]